MSEATSNQLTQANIIGGPTGGIPLSIFKPGSAGVIHGYSNQVRPVSERDQPSIQLRYTIDTDYIYIRGADEKTRPFHFTAKIKNGNTLVLDIFTRGWDDDDNARHPDLFAGKIYDKVFEYFAEQGFDLQFVESHWDHHLLSDNYDAYKRGLQAQNVTEKFATLEQKKNAASNAWTTKRLDTCGYVITEIKSYMGEKTIVTFAKKTQNKIETGENDI